MVQTHKARHADEADTAMVGPMVLLARIVYFIFGVIIALIAVRFVLLLLAANRDNAFVDFIYTSSNMFVAPFHGIFNYTPSYGAAVFEISSVVAMLIYALISWGVVYLLTMGIRNRDGDI